MQIKKVIFFSIGPVFGLLFSLFLVPLTAWIFPPSAIANLSIFNAILNLFTIVILCGQDRSYIRWYYDSNQKAKLRFLGILPILAMLGLISFGYTLINAEELSLLLFKSNNENLLFLTLLATIFSALSRYLALDLRLKDKGLKYSFVTIIPKFSVLNILIFIAYGGLDKTTENLFYTHAFGQFLLLCYVILSSPIKLKKKDVSITKKNIVELQRMISYGGPLLFGSLLYWGLISVDKFILNELSGEKELAVYSVALSFSMAATIIQTVFSTIWAPLVYKSISDGDELSFIGEVNALISIVIVIFMAAVVFFSPFLGDFLPTGYEDVGVLLVVSILCPLLYTLSESTWIGISIVKKPYLSLLSSLIALILSIGFNLYLIPKLGAKGAAISTLIGFFAFFILRTELSCKVWKKIERKKTYILITPLVLLSIVHAVLLSSYVEQIYILWGVYFILALLTSVKEVSRFFKTLRRNNEEKNIRKNF